MFNTKNENYVKIVFFTILFFLVFSLNLIQIDGQHYSKFIDQDTVLIYNSLLLSNNLEVEYLDHPSYTFFFINGFIYKLFSFFDNNNLYNIDYIIKNDDFDIYLQNVFIISRYTNTFIVFLNLIIFFKILIKLNIQAIFAMLSCFILFLQPSFLTNIFFLRSEIWSIFFFLLSFYYILNYFENKNKFYILISGLFFLLSILSKIQILINSFFLFFLIPVLLINKNTDLKLLKYKNFFTFSSIIAFSALIIFHLLISTHVDYKDKMLFDPILQIIGVCIFLLFLKYLNFTKENYFFINIFFNIFFFGFISGLLCFLLLDYFEIFQFNKNLLLRLTYPVYYMSVFISKKTNLVNMTFNTLDSISVFNLLTIVTILLFLILHYYKIQKNYLDKDRLFEIILIVSLIFVLGSQIFRGLYFIYITPFAIILFNKIIISYSNNKKIVLIFIITLLSASNLYASSETIKERFFLKNNNIEKICYDNSTRLFMRYWHKKFDDNFLDKFCSLKK